MDDASMLHADLAGLVGAMLHGRYRVDSLLGAGGMGAVFKGHHVGLGRDVAIKVLHPEFGRDPSVGKRFEREATSASRLDHPNCVRVTDFGTTETGTTYLVMELLNGTELQARLGEPWTPQAAIKSGKQILAGLEHAHHFGIVHRDLKPENVFISKDFRGDEVVKIVDFGIAKLIDEQGVEKLTRQGVVFGTPRYMSPEQAAGGKIDERTDLYAAGLIFYEMLAGRGPFETDDTAQLLRMQIMAPPPPLPESVPAPLAKVVEKLLEKSKSDRYASAREVIAAFDEAEAALAVAAPTIEAVPIVSAGVSSSGAQAPRSGAAWQPAATPPGASTSSGNRTLAYASDYVATRTGNHLGVGQLATGQYESLSAATAVINESWADASSEDDASRDQRTAPVVTIEPIERRPPPKTSQSWVPFAIVGAVVVLALLGVGAAMLLGTDNDPPPEANAASTPNAPAAEPAIPADRPRVVVPTPAQQPAPGPARKSEPPLTPASPPARKSRGPGDQEPSDPKPSDQKPSDPKPSDQKPSDQEPTDQKPAGDQTGVDDPPADATTITDPSGDTKDPPSDGTKPTDATDPAGDAGKRDPQRGKGKSKKEKDKDKAKDNPNPQ